MKWFLFFNFFYSILIGSSVGEAEDGSDSLNFTYLPRPYFC